MTHTYFVSFWNHTFIENASVTLMHEIKNYNDVLEVENLQIFLTKVPDFNRGMKPAHKYIF